MSPNNLSFPGLAVGTLGAALLALTLAAVAHLALMWWAKRTARRSEERATDRDRPSSAQWLARGLGSAIAPLAALVWIYALHYAATLLVAELGSAELLRPALTALGWLRSIGIVLGLLWLASRAGRALETHLTALAGVTDNAWDDIALPILGRAARLTLPLLAVILGVPTLSVPAPLQELFEQGLSIALIGAVAFILFRLVDAAATLLLSRHRIDVSDNRVARGIHTQVVVLRKIATVVIGLFTVASMLTVFESVRQFGTAILASAGVAGIIVGFAAQRSIATLLAGFQIALTQPIRIDDVVIVENEWGRIEEITLTYVVVRIWDLRRLVLPITYFIEQPFQNWTRTSADILATVDLHLDYGTPLQRLREELSRALAASKHWDGKVNVLQVTDAKEHTLEVRALASAADASAAWDLRCEVREQLIQFLQTHHPESLPRLRLTHAAESERPAPGAAGSSQERTAPASANACNATCALNSES